MYSNDTKGSEAFMLIKAYNIESAVKLKERMIDFKIKSNTLSLPSKPEAALKLKTLISSENSNVNKIYNVIMTEPAMCSEILRKANLIASERQNDPINTLSEAIRIIGIFRLTIFAQGEAARKYYVAKTSLGNGFLREAWKRSLNVAAYANAIVDESARLNTPINDSCNTLKEYRETVILCAIIHDIGCIPLFHAIEDLHVNAEDYKHFYDFISSRSPHMGATIMTAWALPNVFIECAKQASVPTPVIDQVINTVKMARILNDYNPSEHLQLLKPFFETKILTNIDVITQENILLAKNKFLADFC
jgi:HD-like signal output (HDOD) protein